MKRQWLKLVWKKLGLMSFRVETDHWESRLARGLIWTPHSLLSQAVTGRPLGEHSTSSRENRRRKYSRCLALTTKATLFDGPSKSRRVTRSPMTQRWHFVTVLIRRTDLMLWWEFVFFLYESRCCDTRLLSRLWDAFIYIYFVAIFVTNRSDDKIKFILFYLLVLRDDLFCWPKIRSLCYFCIKQDDKLWMTQLQ